MEIYSPAELASQYAKKKGAYSKPKMKKLPRENSKKNRNILIKSISPENINKDIIKLVKKLGYVKLQGNCQKCKQYSNKRCLYKLYFNFEHEPEEYKLCPKCRKSLSKAKEKFRISTSVRAMPTGMSN